MNNGTLNNRTKRIEQKQNRSNKRMNRRTQKKQKKQKAEWTQNNEYETKGQRLLHYQSNSVISRNVSWKQPGYYGFQLCSNEIHYIYVYIYSVYIAASAFSAGELAAITSSAADLQPAGAGHYFAGTLAVITSWPADACTHNVIGGNASISQLCCWDLNVEFPWL
jgi:hypothetical protein